MCFLSDFYYGKKVFITGHTGFKGAWLSKILVDLGAQVYGYALEPSKPESLYELLDLDKYLNSTIGDIRDKDFLEKSFLNSNAEIVFHLAAQPLVLESYKNPAYTYETNVMGSVNMFEAARKSNKIKTFINVTTDKVYEDKEWEWGYRETDSINGSSPYANSKSCSELISSMYRKAYKNEIEFSITTLRAGNVIGGGDFTKGRIMTDCVEFARRKLPISVRNPSSVRPYQHVLDVVFSYLLAGMIVTVNKNLQGSYNIGPDFNSCIETGELVNKFCFHWGNDCNWEKTQSSNYIETNFLRLDNSKFKKLFKWRPIWTIDFAIEKTVEWSKQHYFSNNSIKATEKQIEEFKRKFTKLIEVNFND